MSNAKIVWACRRCHDACLWWVWLISKNKWGHVPSFCEKFTDGQWAQTDCIVSWAKNENVHTKNTNLYTKKINVHNKKGNIHNKNENVPAKNGNIHKKGMYIEKRKHTFQE